MKVYVFALVCGVFFRLAGRGMSGTHGGFFTLSVVALSVVKVPAFGVVIPMTEGFWRMNLTEAGVAALLVSRPLAMSELTAYCTTCLAHGGFTTFRLTVDTVVASTVVNTPVEAVLPPMGPGADMM
jgi:hypothetical protein